MVPVVAFPSCMDVVEVTVVRMVPFSPTRPHWAELVIESPCPSVCLSVCAIAKHPLPEVV